MTRTPLSSGRLRWLVAGGYVLSWAIGLLVGGPSLLPDASSTEVELAFSGSTAVLVFAVLVHGVAAVFFAALGWTLPGRGAHPLARALACLAAALSLLQLVGEVLMVVVPDSVDAGAAWVSITRVDGVKMLVLAGLIGAVLRGHGTGRRVLSVVSVVTMIALVVSGAGYVLLDPVVMEAASVSLPLLLIWVLVATAARSHRTMK